MPSILTPKSLRISLGNAGQPDSRPTIRPGTVLYGQVRYKPPSPERITSLTINLLGKLVVKAPKGRRDVTQLFSVQHPILRKEDEPVHVQSTGNTFDFHFVVPWTTEYDRTGTYSPDTQNLFTETQHRLPPTLGSKKGDAQVLYSISAVVRKKGFAVHNLTQLTELPIGEELEIPECIVELSEVDYGLFQEIKRDLTPPSPSTGFFRRRSVTSEHEPGAAMCTVVISGMQTVVLGESYKLHAAVAHHQPTGMQQAQQRWHVAVKGIVLIARVHRRFKDDKLTLHNEETYPIAWPQSPVSVEPGAPLSREIDIGNRIDVVPSFKSYTISRTYRFRVTVLSSLESRNSTASEQHQVDMPIEVVQRVGTLVRRGSRLASVDESGPAVEPPPYEDSPSYVGEPS